MDRLIFALLCACGWWCRCAEPTFFVSPRPGSAPPRASCSKGSVKLPGLSSGAVTGSAGRRDGAPGGGFSWYWGRHARRPSRNLSPLAASRRACYGAHAATTAVPDLHRANQPGQRGRREAVTRDATREGADASDSRERGRAPCGARRLPPISQAAALKRAADFPCARLARVKARSSPSVDTD